jgi:hypothetical protein
MSRHTSAEDMITDQIEREFRKLNSIITDEEDKPAIIQRIAELKAMLDTSRTDIAGKPELPTITIGDIIGAFRRR